MKWHIRERTGVDLPLDQLVELQAKARAGQLVH